MSVHLLNEAAKGNFDAWLSRVREAVADSGERLSAAVLIAIYEDEEGQTDTDILTFRCSSYDLTWAAARLDDTARSARRDLRFESDKIG